jgi:hypothetical protein
MQNEELVGGLPEVILLLDSTISEEEIDIEFEATEQASKNFAEVIDLSFG